MASEPLDDARNRRARVAAAALFLTNGALFANLLPRFPEIKSDLAMSNAVYGGSVAAFSAGALISGLTAAALIRRFQSARVALVTTIALACPPILPAASTWSWKWSAMISALSRVAWSWLST